MLEESVEFVFDRIEPMEESHVFGFGLCRGDLKGVDPPTILIEPSKDPLDEKCKASEKKCRDALEYVDKKSLAHSQGEDRQVDHETPKDLTESLIPFTSISRGLPSVTCVSFQT